MISELLPSLFAGPALTNLRRLGVELGEELGRVLEDPENLALLECLELHVPEDGTMDDVLGGVQRRSWKTLRDLRAYRWPVMPLGASLRVLEERSPPSLATAALGVSARSPDWFVLHRGTGARWSKITALKEPSRSYAEPEGVFWSELDALEVGTLEHLSFRFSAEVTPEDRAVTTARFEALAAKHGVELCAPR